MQVKKIILGVAAVAGLSTAIATNAVAAQPGFYAGIQAGYGNTHLGKNYGNTSNKDTGVAGRVSAGYQFDNTYAAELGLSKFNSAENKATVGASIPVHSRTTMRTNVVDLVGKATMPIANNVNLYGKIGGAYVIQKTTVKSSAIDFSDSANSTQKKLLPTVGVGVSYDFTPNVAADVSYSRIQKVGSSNINSIDFVGAGLTYSFG